MKSYLRQILITLLIALVIFGAVHSTLESREVRLTSMEPSFHEGQRLLVNKVTYHFGSPQRGDVIIFHSPTNPSEAYIKRVIGLPGERVEIKQGDVYINGKLLQEPDYIPKTYANSANTLVPPDRYFVLGDNRNHSNDSPDWVAITEGGAIPEEDIIGKVWLCFWPLSEWGLSPSYSATVE